MTVKAVHRGRVTTTENRPTVLRASSSVEHRLLRNGRRCSVISGARIEGDAWGCSCGNVILPGPVAKAAAAHRRHVRQVEGEVAAQRMLEARVDDVLRDEGLV